MISRPPASGLRSRRPSQRNLHLLAVAGLCGASMTLTTAELRAQSTAPDYKRLSLQELMEIEVTSVSKRSEKLSHSASAIQVITGEDIRRSGATNLPEALRLAPNLQVAQVNASQWAISARGFNNVLANKLLVLVDGRTVYTPLYAGVFWDVQSMLLADLDRIEVISGPGGTLWGANAVNGVINVISKSARETQGMFVEAAAGTHLDFAALRYGGRLAPDLHYRVYGKTERRDSTLALDGTEAGDEWSSHQGGFRLDWKARENDVLTLQADLYEADPNPDAAQAVTARGRNVLARWQHNAQEASGFQIQLYHDYTWRDFRNGFTEALTTWDLDAQHRFALGERHTIIWGAGIRSLDHKVTNLPLFGFFPGNRKMPLYSFFIQDQITAIADRLTVTVGAKFEHNDFTGLEIQPNVRAAWTPSDRHTFWSAVSRGVRTPSRIDHDFAVKLTPSLAFLSGSPAFDSEEVIASELGWRVQPYDALSVSLSLFHNDYDNLRTAEPGPAPFGIPITIANGVEGTTRGAELAVTWQAAPWLRVRGGYTHLDKKLSIKPGSRDLNGGTVESDDPEHQFVLQSSFDLPRNLYLDTVLRYMDDLPSPYVASYLVADVRVAWRPTGRLELSVTGQNLLDRQHLEFIPSNPLPRQIERGVYAKATYSW